MHDRPEARKRAGERARPTAKPSSAADRLAALHAAVGNRALARLVGGGRGLPPDLRTRIERMSGISMGDVRVHTDSPRPAAIQAHAYAAGRDIHLAPGEERHLPHEAWHVVQQKQGRVAPRVETKRTDAPVNEDPSLEAEADRMGAEAARPGGSTERESASAPLEIAPSTHPTVIQGKWFRMSTVLDEDDERAVAEIRELVEAGDWVLGFSYVVEDLHEAKGRFDPIAEAAEENPAVATTVDRVLEGTFFEKSKAFTASEVIDILEAHEVIVNALGSLREGDDTDMGGDSEMEELISMFSDLKIPERFRSDADGPPEDHFVYWAGGDPSLEESDLIVASNPKPLKLLLATKAWGKYKLTDPELDNLKGLRKAAKYALYAIGGNAKRNLKGARTKKHMDAFRLALSAIAQILSALGATTHTSTPVPDTKLVADTSRTEGLSVRADPLSLNSATSGSSPADGPLMKAVRSRAGPERKSYVQMHLLNDLVFGPGELWNLTPGPKQSNSDMEHMVEDPLKRAVLGKGLVLEFQVDVHYDNDPHGVPQTDLDQDPVKYCFRHIDFSATQLEYDGKSHTWKPAAKQDADVGKIDGKRVRWDYGGLTRLKPKPRIFSTATTAKDLEDVGVPAPAAARIVAFVKANPGWRPKGSGRQSQLAAAVKGWDKKKQAPNISKWKATDVLWS